MDVFLLDFLAVFSLDASLLDFCFAFAAGALAFALGAFALAVLALAFALGVLVLGALALGVLALAFALGALVLDVLALAAEPPVFGVSAFGVELPFFVVREAAACASSAVLNVRCSFLKSW